MNELSTNNQKDANEALQVAIIGAGLTGLITAQLLEQSFENSTQDIAITVFEKSAGVGRLATRYKQPEHTDINLEANTETGTKTETNTETGTDTEIGTDTETVQLGQWQFDFGAQFFTAKSQQFKSYLAPYIDQGIVEPWLAKTAEVNALNDESIKLIGQWSKEQPRYISSPKMTSLGRAFAKNLSHTKISYKTRVNPLSDEMSSLKKTYLIDEQSNDLGGFDWVICTAPQAQAIELFEHTSFKHNKSIQAYDMLACYTLMLGWQHHSQLPEKLQTASWDVLKVNSKNHDDLSAIDKVFIEHHKPSRTKLLPSITIHADNIWSEQHVDDDIDLIKSKLMTEAQRLLEWQDSTSPTHIDCHRWRYAATKQITEDGGKEINNELSDEGRTDDGRNIHLHKGETLGHDRSVLAYVDDNKNWIVTGDWCDEGRIESCFNVAQAVIEIITE